MRIRSLTILWALAIQCPIFAYAGGESIVSRDSVACSIEEMWQRTLHHHLLLNAKQKEVEVAKASLAQEKLWENPQISLSHNINNPVTHRYFEFNKEGQTDIQISQRIYIAGQRGERIRMASEEMSRAQYGQLDAERLMRKSCPGRWSSFSHFSRRSMLSKKRFSRWIRSCKRMKNKRRKGMFRLSKSCGLAVCGCNYCRKRRS
ncbi:MAG: TolC family protein [Phocaeicola vulgatus]|nr:MAG: TolC family protein [Phocaeicola vulgatus]